MPMNDPYSFTIYFHDILGRQYFLDTVKIMIPVNTMEIVKLLQFLYEFNMLVISEMQYHINITKNIYQWGGKRIEIRGMRIGNNSYFHSEMLQ